MSYNRQPVKKQDQKIFQTSQLLQESVDTVNHLTINSLNFGALPLDFMYHSHFLTGQPLSTSNVL